MDWKRLISVLSEEKAIYEELLACSDEKRNAVYEGQLERLDAVVRKEQAAAARLEHWEKQRLACMDAPEGSSDSPTLLFFATLAPGGEGEALRALHGELSELLRDLQAKNAENKVLLESRLDYAKFAIDALHTEQSGGLYGSRYGSEPPGSGLEERRLFDKKG
ncbi:MAG: flagellar protein FlgN [Oscillospiraceae bacterium]|nr:flagellar protein FlgN [Oscillospiraceae bacterium]